MLPATRFNLIYPTEWKTVIYQHSGNWKSKQLVDKLTSPTIEVMEIN